MTAQEFFQEQTWYENAGKYTEEDVIEMMVKYAEIKSIETFRNTRYAAMEIVLEELVGTDEVAVDLINNRIQNIKWSEVKPEFE